MTPNERLVNDQRYVDQIPKEQLYNADGTPTPLLTRMMQMRTRAGFTEVQVRICRVSMRKVHQAALKEQEAALTKKISG